MAATPLHSSPHLLPLPLPLPTIFRKPTTTTASFSFNFQTRALATANIFHPISNNSSLWTASEIAEAANGIIVKWAPPGPISTDTRTLQPGQWFLPIAGQNFDAHHFITPQLSTKGCVGVIGNRVCENWDKGFVQVQGNTLISLEKMAIYARNRFFGCLIGLTGSVGKTTTKAMLALALESVFDSVYQSHGNWNNRIGVGLSLIGIPHNVGVAVLELGMSGEGEILELARMCRPSIRVILNVGPSHLENFASLQELSIAKGEIFREAKPGDVCVLNADDPLVMSLPIPLGVTKVLFGQRMDCDVRLVFAGSTNGGLGVRVVLERNKEMVDFVISSPGRHLALDACAAAAVASFLGVPLAQVGISLSRYIPVYMRSELEVAKNGIKVINDAYNASPASTKAAIDLLKGIDCKGKRVAVLGDTLELGPMEIKFHEIMLQHCCDADLDMVALVGKRFLTAAENLNLVKTIKVVHACDADNLALVIGTMLNCDDVVLVKGSRAMKMEKIIDAIKLLHMVSPY